MVMKGLEIREKLLSRGLEYTAGLLSTKFFWLPGVVLPLNLAVLLSVGLASNKSSSPVKTLILGVVVTFRDVVTD